MRNAFKLATLPLLHSRPSVQPTSVTTNRRTKDAVRARVCLQSYTVTTCSLLTGLRTPASSMDTQQDPIDDPLHFHDHSGAASRSTRKRSLPPVAAKVAVKMLRVDGQFVEAYDDDFGADDYLDDDEFVNIMTECETDERPQDAAATSCNANEVFIKSEQLDDDELQTTMLERSTHHQPPSGDNITTANPDARQSSAGASLNSVATQANVCAGEYYKLRRLKLAGPQQ